ncbi:MAG: Dam family site-specific DNA-(adenine-N6)-methyltransferase [Solirubrobacterales bacterium]
MTQSFIKWAGGKSWLAEAVGQLLGEPRGRYIEPFVGSGAVFFELEPARAVLSDANSELVNALKVVRDNPGALKGQLRRKTISAEHFLAIRASRPKSEVGRAARFVYLNRTAFNGIWRVNRQGDFNVPFGCKPGTVLFSSDGIDACSIALANADLEVNDFRASLTKVQTKDSVYVDPPYTVSHNNNGFRRYNEKIFSWDDQRDLAARVNGLGKRGVRVVVSNAHHRQLAELYSDEWLSFAEVRRQTRIAGSAEHRGITSELVIATKQIAPSNKVLAARLRGAGVAARALPVRRGD